MSKVDDIREALGDIRPKKRLGQNFMLDGNLLEAVVRDAGVTAEDTVLEIGTGMGALTEVLVRAARWVLSVEIDPEFARIASEKFAGSDNLEIMNADILEQKNMVSDKVASRLRALLPEEESPVLVGNLPYSNAGPIIAALMFWDLRLARAVITIQKEMAERLVAKPGTKAYGKLSVLVQHIADAELLREVPAVCFWPRPEVDSAVVRMTPKRTAAEDTRVLSLLATGVFQHRRKVIRNALIDATNMELGADEVDGLLRATAIDPSLHADGLTVTQLESTASLLEASSSSSGVLTLKKL